MSLACHNARLPAFYWTKVAIPPLKQKVYFRQPTMGCSSIEPLLLRIILLSSISSAFVTGERILTNADLLNGNYSEIHRRSVIDQIQRHIPAQKSLHTRYTIPLDGLYDFCFDDSNQGFDEEWHSTSLKHSCRRGNLYRMPVPSAFNDIPSNRTARNYVGWFWYQTELSLSHFQSMKHHEEPCKNWFIQFENINYLSIVWVQRLSDPLGPFANSTQSTYLLGSHVGGYLPFLLNMTEAVSREDTSARYRITVAVSNMLTKDTIPSGRMLNLTEQVGRSFYKFQPDFDFFHFAGILGSVHVIRLPQVHIQNVDILTGPLLINNYPNVFNVCLSGHIAHLKQAELRMWVQIFDPDEKFIGGTSLVKRSFSTQLDTCHRLELHKVHNLEQVRWSLSNGDPNHFSPLVKVRFQFDLSVGNGIDLDGDPLGSNLYQVISDLFELNLGVGNAALLDSGRGLSAESGTSRIQLQGFGMHHEQFFSGRTMNQPSIMKDMYLLKQIGANVIRTSHYPYSVEYLDACDENGIMVIAECPAVGLNSFSELKLMLHKQILLEMMQRDHHHPSIVMWSVANEPQSQLKEAQGYFESLLKYAREDLSQYTVGRPLTAAIAQSHANDKVAHTLDVIMVNRYYGWYDYSGVLEAIRMPLIASLSGWSQRFPEKPIILSEFGADTVSGIHSSTREIFSEEYQRDLLMRYENVFNELFCDNQTHSVNFWGSMIWNFADFSTHDSLLRVAGNKKGIYDRARQPKLAALSIASVYLNRLKHGCPHNEAVSR